MDSQRLSYYVNKIVNSDKSIIALNEVSEELKAEGETHVCIEIQLAYVLWQNNLMNDAFAKFKYIINTEINNDYSTFDTPLADAVGMASSFLIREYYLKKDEDFYELFVLSYLYLTSHIKNSANIMCDSLENRAIISEDCEKYLNLFSMIRLDVLFFIPIPMIISDYLHAALIFQKQGIADRMTDCVSRAQNLHQFIGDIEIGGKEGSQYSLVDIALLGNERIEKVTSSAHPVNIVEKQKLAKILFT